MDRNERLLSLFDVAFLVLLLSEEVCTPHGADDVYKSRCVIGEKKSNISIGCTISIGNDGALSFSLCHTSEHGHNMHDQ